MPALFRRVKDVHYRRERIDTPDGDFLDLDWLPKASSRLVILSHGLEGNTNRKYMKGMARAFSHNHWEVLAWNCRSCSGEMNRTPRLYHHGDTEDLGFVIDHALGKRAYDAVALVGFSMGGSMTLKYLGTRGNEAPSPIVCGIAFSTPTDLEASVDTLELPGNGFYKRRFFNSLKAKLIIKERQFPGTVDSRRFNQVKSWKDFDEWFSAPMLGLGSAHEFYEQASARNFMAGSAVPLLVVNAQNDPLLLPACTPVDLARKHSQIYVERPSTGGHVGFQTRAGYFWSERRALEFAETAASERLP